MLCCQLQQVVCGLCSTGNDKSVKVIDITDQADEKLF